MKSKSLTSYGFRLSLGAFVVLMLSCGSVFAQGQGMTAIRGTIKDPQGSVVAGAECDADQRRNQYHSQYHVQRQRPVWF